MKNHEHGATEILERRAPVPLDRGRDPVAGARRDGPVIDLAFRTLLAPPDEQARRSSAAADARGAANRDDRDAVTLDARRGGDARRDRDAARCGRADEPDRWPAPPPGGGGPGLRVDLGAGVPPQAPAPRSFASRVRRS